MTRAIHYSGGVSYPRANGTVASMLPGWPACVSGARATAIRADGRQTPDRDKVTCAWCRNRMAREKHDRFKPTKKPATTKLGFETRAARFVRDLKKLYEKYDVALGGTGRDGSLSLELSDGEKRLDQDDIEIVAPRPSNCPTCGWTPGSALCLSICEAS